MFILHQLTQSGAQYYELLHTTDMTPLLLMPPLSPPLLPTHKSSLRPALLLVPVKQELLFPLPMLTWLPIPPQPLVVAVLSQFPSPG